MLGIAHTPANALLSSAKIELGRALFFDKRLSEDRTVSCATCHDPAAAFAGKEALAVGVGNKKTTRNAPTLLNTALSSSYFWDGRAATLEEQAKQPLLNPNEMGMADEAALVARVSAISEYRQSFRRVFPREGITLNTIATAIAAFERSLVSNDAPFDRFIRGNKKALTAAQQRGMELFKGKAKCADCHLISGSVARFRDEKFHNTGIGANDAAFSDPGRFLVTRNQKDLGAFKTPSLRDVELTGPYMHDGSLKTLLDVVRFYNQGGNKNPMLDEKMFPLNLTESEMNELVDFLRALTSDGVLRLVQSSKPQTRERAR
ncbi:MAG TPA: cytochrome c peroxidase [Pyrinomonadaceae bacterium]|nr:cytochrome c peroxidase [Pyrinomonadaceae bacterium]